MHGSDDKPGNVQLYRYRFGSAEFDEARFELQVAGLPVELERRPLEVLLELLRHAGEVVSKEALFTSVWAGRITVDNVLPNAVAKLRKALGAANAEQLLTHPRTGYRLTGTVERIAVGRRMQSRLKLRSGETVPGRDHFVLRSQIGSTAASEVWLAEHAKTRERRVYKFSADGRQLGALKREATLARLLREELGEREDIVRVLDWNFESLPYFLECEYGGQNLLEWSQQGQHLQSMPLEQRLLLFLKIADAVADAHRVGVLHKDLKPANVLVAERADGGWQLRLTDFGSAHLLDPDRLDELGITRLGLTMTQGAAGDSSAGTPLYLAPELIAGQGATVQSDVYALGLMLYQLLVADLKKPMAPGWEQDVDDDLLRADIAAATDGHPARRLAGVGELAERLRTRPARALQRDRERDAELRARSAERALERARARRPLLAGVLAALLLGLGTSLWFFHDALQSERRLARQYAVVRDINRFITQDLIGASNPAISGRANVTVIEAAKAAIPKIDSRFADDAPEVQGALHRALQESLSALTDAAGAIDEGRKAVEAYERAQPPDRAGASAARLSLVSDLGDASRYAEAAALLDRVEADLPALRIDHPDLPIQVLAARSGLDRKQLHLDPALEHAQQAWALIQMRPDVPGDLRDSVEFGLADTLRMQGRLKQSEGFQRDLAARQATRLGPGHPQTLYSIAAVANSLVYQQRCDEAVQLVIPAIQGLEAALGPDNRRTLNAKNVLASAYFNQRRFDLAAPVYQQIYAALVRKYGENNQNAITQLFNVGMATQYSGHPAEAEPIYRRALAAARQLFGEDESQVQSLRYHLADCLLDLRRPLEAAPLLAGLDAEVLNRSEQESDWRGRLDYQAGRIALARGDVDDARALLQKAAAEIDADAGGADEAMPGNIRRLLAQLGENRPRAIGATRP